MDEAAGRVEADAHAARVERLGVRVHLVDRDARDADVHRRRVEVAARVALREPEARHQVDLLAFEVIVEPRQLLVELGADRADLAGARAAEQLVELGERRLVEAAVRLVDVDRDLFVEVLGADPDVARRLVERLGAQRRSSRRCGPEGRDALASLLRLLASREWPTRSAVAFSAPHRRGAHAECRNDEQGKPLHRTSEARPTGRRSQ